MTTARKTCHKRRFPDEFAVSKWLKRMQSRADQGNGVQHIPVRYYFHQDCHGYHVTSKPPRE